MMATIWLDFGERYMLSRRSIMAKVASAMAASPWLAALAARASEKMTRKQAEYQDTPNGI